jgi:predicted nucleic acid-binding protein
VTVVDASVWLRAHHLGEPHHEETGNWLDMMLATNSGIALPTLFLAEIGGALARSGMARETLVDVISQIVHDPSISVYAVDLSLAALSIDIVSATGLRGSDAIYVALALRLHLPLVSWDKEHLSRASSVVDVMTPVQALERFPSQTS